MARAGIRFERRLRRESEENSWKRINVPTGSSAGTAAPATGDAKSLARWRVPRKNTAPSSATASSTGQPADWRL
jgi:hypothetical protein